MKMFSNVCFCKKLTFRTRFGVHLQTFFEYTNVIIDIELLQYRTHLSSSVLTFTYEWVSRIEIVLLSFYVFGRPLLLCFFKFVFFQITYSLEHTTHTRGGVYTIC